MITIYTAICYIQNLFIIITFSANNSIQIAGVQYIYDSVIDELWKDPEKKFVSVEMEFFFHWWTESDLKTKEKVFQIIDR